MNEQVLPDFLAMPLEQVDPKERERQDALARIAKKALMEQSFDIAFETILERTSNGEPLDRIAREYHTHLPIAALRTWIYKDTKRKNAYMVAKAIGAEAIEDELIRISDGVKADGSASLDDTTRSALRIKTRQWLLEKWNRKRYGDVKTVEQTTHATVDVANMTTDDLKRLVLKEMGMTDDAPSTIFENDAPFDTFDE